MRRYLWIALAVIIAFIIFSPHTPPSKQVRELEELSVVSKPTPTSKLKKDVDKTFVECLSEKSKNGAYSSFDGGQSAIRLLDDCNVQWKEWHSRCMADGTSDPDCTLRSGLLSQAAIKLTEK
jgi:two-component SAPR family response regulator